MYNYFILLAAGSGKRFKSSMPKQYTFYKQKQLLVHSIDKAIKSRLFKRVILVINKRHKKYTKNLKKKEIRIIYGGFERFDSTFNALNYIKKKSPKNIFIHDASRPNFSLKLLNRINKQMNKNNAVIPALKPNDSVKFINKKNNFNLDRNKILLTQTPQAFKFKILYKLFKKRSKFITDDASLFIDNNFKVKFIEGEKNNLKITNKLDIKKNIQRTNYGIGFDIHRLENNRKLYLGGIKIPYHLGLKGHSDGDVIIHALIDSILGACKLKDIGTLFSNKKKKYKNIRSSKMLIKVLNLINQKEFYINNIDINVITERPKISKYRNKIIDSISKLCNINKNQINIKGKTSEKLGLIGKEKAIACEVIASVVKYA